MSSILEYLVFTSDLSCAAEQKSEKQELDKKQHF